MQRTNLVGMYITMSHPKTGLHNFRMTPDEMMAEDFRGYTLKSMRGPQSFKLGDMIDPTTSAILTAFAKLR